MTSKNQNIKSRFTFFTASVIVLLVLILIVQYNNFFYTRRALSYNDQINNLLIIPSQLRDENNCFVYSDLLNDRFFTSDQGSSIDSIKKILAGYELNTDRLLQADYLNLSHVARLKLSALKMICRDLDQRYAVLKTGILGRGLYTSGQSGAWERYGEYLQELSFSYHNTELSQKVSQLIRQQNEYQITKESRQVSAILETVNAVKLGFSDRQSDMIKGIPLPDRLKFINELQNFAAQTQALYKTDAALGISGSQGQMSAIRLQLHLLDVKSREIFNIVHQNIMHSFFTSFLWKALLILILAIIYYIVLSGNSKNIHRSIQKIKMFASELVRGILPPPVSLDASSELAETGELLNSFVQSLHEKVQFASNLGKGRNDIKLEPLSENDRLANALLDMEKSLNKAAEEDRKYKIDEQKRAWANEGLAKFGEILRMQTDNLVKLSDEIIDQLVKYLNANQGGLFLLNDENYADIHLELLSSVAYDRKKFQNKRIEIGEGLVGTCVQEQQTIFLTDIPENYIEITSGLGQAPPKSLLIVPMKTQEAVFGILELASFHVFQPNEIEFVEKIAQSIASTFASVKISINTSRLLEQSKKQAEEMAQQEEEMRQNLEELQATQEESARREAEINSLVHAVDESSLVIQTDMEGRIIEMNKKFASVLKLRRDELLSRTLKSVFMFDHENEEFYNLLQTLKQGQSEIRDEEVHHPNGTIDYLLVHYSPILDKEGQPYKILGIASSVTESKVLERNLHKKQEIFSDLEFNFNQYSHLIDDGFIHCELNTIGEILEVNENYSEISGYHRQELIGKDYRKFLKPDEANQFELIWTEVHKDKTYKGVIKRTKPTGDQCWLISCFIPFKDQQGLIHKIHLFALDITEKKLKYQVLEEANKEIERLRGMLG